MMMMMMMDKWPGDDEEVKSRIKKKVLQWNKLTFLGRAYMFVIVGRPRNIQRWRIGCEIRRYLREKLQSELKPRKRSLNTGVHEKRGFLRETLSPLVFVIVRIQLNLILIDDEEWQFFEMKRRQWHSNVMELFSKNKNKYRHTKAEIFSDNIRTPS